MKKVYLTFIILISLLFTSTFVNADPYYGDEPPTEAPEGCEWVDGYTTPIYHDDGSMEFYTYWYLECDDGNQYDDFDDYCDSHAYEEQCWGFIESGYSSLEEYCDDDHEYEEQCGGTAEDGYYDDLDSYCRDGHEYEEQCGGTVTDGEYNSLEEYCDDDHGYEEQCGGTAEDGYYDDLSSYCNDDHEYEEQCGGSAENGEYSDLNDYCLDDHGYEEQCGGNQPDGYYQNLDEYCADGHEFEQQCGGNGEDGTYQDLEEYCNSVYDPDYCNVQTGDNDNSYTTDPNADTNSTYTQQQAENIIDNEGITFSNTSGTNCTDVNNPTCTSLDGIREYSLNRLVGFKEECFDCIINITGGTERGGAHNEDGLETHKNGYKIDISLNTNVNNYIEITYAKTRYIRTSDKAICYHDDHQNDFCKEIKKNHWDIKFDGNGGEGDIDYDDIFDDDWCAEYPDDEWCVYEACLDDPEGEGCVCDEDYDETCNTDEDDEEDDDGERMPEIKEPKKVRTPFGMKFIKDSSFIERVIDFIKIMI